MEGQMRGVRLTKEQYETAKKDANKLELKYSNYLRYLNIKANKENKNSK